VTVSGIDTAVGGFDIAIAGGVDTGIGSEHLNIVK
jgi:hypothetical protein